nr:hypothetical protein [uncultured Oscillibacter sp.]
MWSATTPKFIERFGGSLHYAMPGFGLVYHYRGRDYHLHDFTPEAEAVMVDSLKQGKNLIPKTFPVVDLYPYPDRVY